jgi:hypothetical protein
MGMKRRFQAECDQCFRKDTEASQWASDIRERLTRLNWTVGNQLYCPVCNGKDPSYNEFEQVVSVEAILTIEEQKIVARQALQKFFQEIK